MIDGYVEYLDRSRAYYNARFGQGFGTDYQPNLEEKLRWAVIRDAVDRYVAGRTETTHILDFGCGAGWMSYLLSSCGRVTGADLSDRAVENARANYPGIEFVCLDATENVKTTLNREFDLVVSSEVIEHVVNQQDYMRNVISLLRPGGMLVLTTTNGPWKEHLFYRRKNWMQPYELWLSQRELLGLVEGLLEQVSIRTFNANWVFDLRTFGWPNLIGNRFWRMFLAATGLKGRFLAMLERRGYGLNLLLEGRVPVRSAKATTG